MERTALLVRCTTDEAARIRTEAEKQRRTISGYVLQITLRAMEIEDRLFRETDRLPVNESDYEPACTDCAGREDSNSCTVQC